MWCNVCVTVQQSKPQGDVAECLDQVNRLATEQVIKKDIVVLLDFSDFVRLGEAKLHTKILGFSHFIPFLDALLSAKMALARGGIPKLLPCHPRAAPHSGELCMCRALCLGLRDRRP